MVAAASLRVVSERIEHNRLTQACCTGSNGVDSVDVLRDFIWVNLERIEHNQVKQDSCAGSNSVDNVVPM
jgi:hypothetical protein